MTYTVWHDGKLLGESPLDFMYREHNTRTGFLHPTPWGEKVLPLAGGTCAAANALHRAARHCRTHEEQVRLPEYAAFEAASATCASYRLELRGPDGSVIPTRDVGVRDYGFIDELGDDAFVDDELDERGVEEAEEILASIREDDVAAAWTPEADRSDAVWEFDEESLYEPWRQHEERDCERRTSRFQVMVELIDDAAIP